VGTLSGNLAFSQIRKFSQHFGRTYILATFWEMAIFRSKLKYQNYQIFFEPCIIPSRPRVQTDILSCPRCVTFFTNLVRGPETLPAISPNDASEAFVSYCFHIKSMYRFAAFLLLWCLLLPKTLQDAAVPQMDWLRVHQSFLSHICVWSQPVGLTEEVWTNCCIDN